MPNYPSKALQEYALKSDLLTLVVGPGGPGPAGPAGPDGSAGSPGAPWAPVQSATAPATASSGTIATAALTVSRVAPVADISSVILQAGTVAAQQIAVLNESAFSITFGLTGLSGVASGTACVIAALTHVTFVWDNVTALWYALDAGAGSGGGSSGIGTFGYQTFGANNFGGGTGGSPPPIDATYDAGRYDIDLYSGSTSGLYGTGLYDTDLYG